MMTFMRRLLPGFDDMRTTRPRDSQREKTRASGVFATPAWAFAACGMAWAALIVASPEAFAQGTGARTGQQTVTETAQQRRARTAQQAAPAAPQPQQAAPKRQPKGFIDTILEGPRLTTTPPEAADWVRQTRPDPNAPRGPATTTSSPPRPLLSADEIRAREAALDRARVRHDTLAGRRTPSGKFGSAAGKPVAKDNLRPKSGCVLTCGDSIGVPQTQRR